MRVLFVARQLFPLMRAEVMEAFEMAARLGSFNLNPNPTQTLNINPKHKKNVMEPFEMAANLGSFNLISGFRVEDVGGGLRIWWGVGFRLDPVP
jgi:hypothetical protein